MKKITAFLLALCLCALLCSCMIGQSADVMGKPKLCDTCKEFVVGKWYSVNGKGELITCEYRQDGTLVGMADTRWSCACENGNHAVRIGGENYSVGLTYYDPENGGFEGMEKDEGYTFVELTQDNWKDYFQEDCSQVFDVRYFLLPTETTDEWGETKTTYVLAKFAVLKDSNKYGPMTSLLVELDIAGTDEYVTMDPEKKEILSVELNRLGEGKPMTKMANWDDTLGVGILLGDRHLGTPEEIVYACMEEPGDTIYRMKGILVIK